ncbi:MAG: urea ABC transporter permease subunit UrtB [Immundisolibacter sp.]|uniref:urea ABC transporter permease subunit UrtB n=1 Tax=Immundisolibacter sp. TaxID=1934948 RepID=UPI003EDFA4A1
MPATLVALAMLLCALLSAPTAAQEDPPHPANAVQALGSAGFSAKQALLRTIADSGEPWARTVLQGLLDGALQNRKADRRVVLTKPAADGFDLADPVSGEPLGHAGRYDLKRIPINNALRTELNGLIARLSLADPDPRQRRAAVRALYDTLDTDSAALLRARRTQETNGGVRKAIDIALAMADLTADASTTRVAATQQLAGSVEPSARVRLGALADDAAQPQDVRDAARRALTSSDRRIGLYRVAETAFFGMSLGSVLLLAAIGLAISFGVMGVINMAHGEFLMLGAYTTFVVQQWVPVDWSLPVAIPLAFVVAGTFGVLLERCLIRFLYGRPLETLLATFGVSLVLQQLVRSVFSPLNRQVATPSWMSGSVELNPALSLTLNRLYIVGFSLVVFGLLLAVLRFTRFGLELRAVSQNRAMARALGVRSARVDALTFGLGAGIAGVGGVALSQLTNVGPNLGQAYIVDAFLVVVFGGVGNLWGTLTAALTLGVANKLMEPWVGAVLAKILVLVFIILFIQRRPRGLFPQRGRAAEA